MVRISAVGIDHCETIRNAAQACGPLDSATRVVDCIVHVERNMIRHQNLIVVRGATSASCDDANLEETENTPTPKQQKVDGAKKIFFNAARENVRFVEYDLLLGRWCAGLQPPTICAKSYMAYNAFRHYYRIKLQKVSYWRPTPYLANYHSQLRR
jgi:hypothetical protein